jgi:hypothetical protein
MDGVGSVEFGQKFIEVYGPLGLGWLAWVFTMFYLRAERKRYQDLVILIVQYFTKVNMLERSESRDQNPLEYLLNRGRTPPSQRSSGSEVDRRTSKPWDDQE